MGSRETWSRNTHSVAGDCQTGMEIVGAGGLHGGAGAGRCQRALPQTTGTEGNTFRVISSEPQLAEASVGAISTCS